MYLFRRNEPKEENFGFCAAHYSAGFYLYTMFQTIISDGIIIRQCLHT